MFDKEMEKEVIKNLKKYEKDRDNIIGMIYSLRTANNYELALIKFNNYLNNQNASKTRNDLFVYIDKIVSNT